MVDGCQEGMGFLACLAGARVGRGLWRFLTRRTWLVGNGQPSWLVGSNFPPQPGCLTIVQEQFAFKAIQLGFVPLFPVVSASVNDSVSTVSPSSGFPMGSMGFGEEREPIRS